MTIRPAFDDFAAAARAQLRGPVGPELTAARPPDTAGAGTVQELAYSMDRVLTVMARYSADIAAVLADTARPRTSLPGTWLWASIRAQDAIQNTRGFLQPARACTRPSRYVRATGPQVCGLDAAAMALDAGRDLLHTHVVIRPDAPGWNVRNGHRS